jgi:hypothetical protein
VTALKRGKHDHIMQEVAWEFLPDDPRWPSPPWPRFSVLLYCFWCMDLYYIHPRKRLRKVPPGMEPERFRALCELAEDPERLALFRGFIRGVRQNFSSDQIWARAKKTGRVPPIPAVPQGVEQPDTRNRKAA